MTKDKDRSRSTHILELALERIIMDAAAVFPVNEPYVLVKWVETLKLLVVEATKRIHISGQPKYKDLSVEEKVETLLAFTHKKVDEILKFRMRKESADSFLSLETEGPPPLSPASLSDETPAPQETSDSKGNDESH